MSKTANHEIRKVYWKIGEVAIKFNISTSKARFWNDFFDIATSRTSRGERVFIEKDLEKFTTLHLLVEKLGFTLSGAAKVMSVLEDNKSLDNQQMYRIIKELEHLIVKRDHMMLTRIDEAVKRGHTAP